MSTGATITSNITTSSTVIGKGGQSANISANVVDTNTITSSVSGVQVTASRVDNALLVSSVNDSSQATGTITTGGVGATGATGATGAQGPKGDPGSGGGGVPSGGTLNQLLVKQSAVDGDAIWEALNSDIITEGTTHLFSQWHADPSNGDNLVVNTGNSGGLLNVDTQASLDLYNNNITGLPVGLFSIKNNFIANGGIVAYTSSYLDIGFSFFGGRTRGTTAAPTTVVNGDILMSFFPTGYDGTGMSYNAGGIFFKVDGVPSAGSMPIKTIIASNGGTARITVRDDGTIEGVFDGGTP